METAISRAYHNENGSIWYVYGWPIGGSFDNWTVCLSAKSLTEAHGMAHKLEMDECYWSVPA